MLEVALLIALALLVPHFDRSPWWWIVVIVFVAPGLLASWSGAPFVPTSRKTVRKMLALADIKPGEKVYDLGCGDGRIVFAAAKLGANAVGYEYSIPTFLIAWTESLIHRRSKIRFANFWKANLHDADVIFVYLLKDSMKTFEQHLWPTLKPGCRVVSHAFKMEHAKPVKEESGVVLYSKGG